MFSTYMPNSSKPVTWTNDMPKAKLTQRTRQLRVLRVRASQALAAYVAAPGSHHVLDALRHTAADLLQHRRQLAATHALRAWVLLHEYGDQSTYYFNHLHRQRQQLTVITHLQQQQESPVADLCTMHGRQQADNIIFYFFSADSPTGMFRQLPTDLSAHELLLSLLDRQLPSEAQQACEGAEQGITLEDMTGFDLFGMCVLHVEPDHCFLGVHFDFILWCLCYRVLTF